MLWLILWPCVFNLLEGPVASTDDEVVNIADEVADDPHNDSDDVADDHGPQNDSDDVAED